MLFAEFLSQVPWGPGIWTGIRYRDLAWHNKYLAQRFLCTPAQTQPFESTPTIRFSQHGLSVQPNPYPQQPYGTATKSTKPDGKFGIKIRPFGKEHGDIGLL